MSNGPSDQELQEGAKMVEADSRDDEPLVRAAKILSAMLFARDATRQAMTPKAPEQPDGNVIVTINGGKYAVLANTPLSYRDVADIAGFKSPALPSMTLRQKSYEGRIVHPGESVMTAPGMVFNVADTSNA